MLLKSTCITTPSSHYLALGKIRVLTWNRQDGFTLVELSIVLVIIGLLIGGILAAQSMISTAKLQTLVKTIQQYDVAATNFETKYNGQVPGDSIAFACRAYIYNTCGDGQVYTDRFVFSGGNAPDLTESLDFWKHLNQAGLLSQSFTGYPAGGFPGNSFLPPGDFTGYLPTLAYGTKTFLSANTIIADAPQVYFGNAWIIEGNLASNASPTGLTTNEALALDSKLDDGVATTGNIQSLSAFSGPYLSSATANTQCPDYTNLGNTAPVCALAIKAQW